MHMIIATGGSDHSTIAVQAGLALAQRLRATVTLLHVIGHEGDRAAATATLDALSARAAATGLQAAPTVRVGRVLNALYEELRRRPTDLLVLGERAEHRMLTRIRGSIVSRLASSAPCPVLIAKRADLTVDKALICDSGAAPPTVFDGLAEHGLAPILQGAAITVLHVMSQISAGPGVAGRLLRAEADELMRVQAPEGALLTRDLAFLDQHGLTGTAKVRHGLVTDEILAESSEGDYDLIIIGGHRTGGWPALLLDDLAHQIITRVDRSLLVVR